MKKLITLAVFALIMGLTAKAYAVSLVDVPSGHWAEDAVQKLVDAGLIEGYPDGTFKGDRPMTRYEYAMVVARLMDGIDKKYCTPEKCKGGVDNSAKIDELKSTLEKLAAEFKDELAALKVQVDNNGKRIDAIEKRLDQPMVGKLMVSGSLRQRVDAPHSDLEMTTGSVSKPTFTRFYLAHYNSTSPADLKAGYEAHPVLTFTGNVKPNAKVNLQLATFLSNIDQPQNTPLTGTNNSELAIDFANVELDFSTDVKELDTLKTIVGYQQLVLGPLGMLLDNSGLVSSPAVALVLGKDAVTITSAAGLRGINSTGGTTVAGLGANTYDAIVATRLGIDINRVKLGFNWMSTGYLAEKGWSGDIQAQLLKSSPFLKSLKGEYLTITDSYTGGAWGTTVGGVATTPKDYSYALFLEAYRTKRVGLTVSYADTPAVPTVTSLDSNPFTEFDAACALGTDYPNTTARPCISRAFESGRMLFPGGFKGLGVEASYIVLGDVTLGAKAILGDYAGGNAINAAGATVYARGYKYPAYGALSITKPINDDTQFKVEYMQQGKDPVLLNRVRGELLINF